MIKFHCPQCKQVLEGPDEAVLIEVDCPSCQHHFKPHKLIPPPGPTLAESTKRRMAGNEDAPPAPESWSEARQDTLESRRRKIRQHAELITGIAILFAVVGGIALLIMVVSQAATESVAYSPIIAVSSFSLAVTGYLIAQLVFIRANTER